MTRTYDYIIIHFIQRHLSQIFYIETKGFLNWIVPYIFDKYGHKTLIVITHSNGQIPFKAHKPACTSCLMHTCIFWIDYSIHTTFECNLCGRSMWKVSKLWLSVTHLAVVFCFTHINWHIKIPAMSTISKFKFFIPYAMRHIRYTSTWYTKDMYI